MGRNEELGGKNPKFYLIQWVNVTPSDTENDFLLKANTHMEHCLTNGKRSIHLN